MARGKSRRSLALIDACIDFHHAIHPATVRAVCYQLFTRGLIASMAKTETNRVGQQLTDARFRGWIPDDWIVDETREAECLPSWATPDAYVETVRNSYRKDHWALQPRHVEVWSEKGTVRGTLAPVLQQYGVTFRVMHGFTSTTNISVVTQERLRLRRPFMALYVGDFDPSGLYMSEEDLPERLDAHWHRRIGIEALKRANPHLDGQMDYGRWHAYTPATLQALGETRLWHERVDDLPSLTVERIALTEADVVDGQLLSYDVTDKQGDPRYEWYVQMYGNAVGRRAWELDAMNPNDLRARVEHAIASHLNHDMWARSTANETVEAESLRTVLDRWNADAWPADAEEEGDA
jgi:hypothetical protein